MAKIYTKTGDDGLTGLIGGSRVAKSDARIECYGTVDELNAAIGFAAVAPVAAELLEQLRRVQNELFVAGSHLAVPSGGDARSLPALDSSMVARLEQEIDAADGELPPLQNFILPGGTDAAARLHIARTVCRRAERLVVARAGDGTARDGRLTLIVAYLNRLGDWLFVQARLVNHRAGVADVPWKP